MSTSDSLCMPSSRHKLANEYRKSTRRSPDHRSQGDHRVGSGDCKWLSSFGGVHSHPCHQHPFGWNHSTDIHSSDIHNLTLTIKRKRLTAAGSRQLLICTSHHTSHPISTQIPSIKFQNEKSTKINKGKHRNRKTTLTPPDSLVTRRQKPHLGAMLGIAVA